MINESIPFEAVCVKINGNYAHLKHPNLDKFILVDSSKFEGCKFEIGQKWQVTVTDQIYYYKATSAKLLSTNATLDSLSTAGLPARYFPLHPLVDKTERKRLIKSLDGLSFDAVCIKGSGDSGFLQHPEFEGRIVIKRKAAQGLTIAEGQKWRITVTALLNDKKKKWYYAAKTAELLTGGVVAAQGNPMPAGSTPGSQTATPQSNSPTPALPSVTKVVPPEDDLPHWTSCTDTLATTRHICIYIDETWPGTQNPEMKGIGVIGGIAVPWAGSCDSLPVIRTHLDVESSIPAMGKMLAVKEILPFVFPITVNGAATSKYFELVRHAIMLLLGWMLPAADHVRTVDIYLEHIGDYDDGHEETIFITALKEAMGMLSNTTRFKKFLIGKVKWVPKDFLYVPYGDLVCKTCVPEPKRQQVAKMFNAAQWDGYLPFTEEIFPRLREMDNDSPAGFADHLLQFARAYHGAPLCRRMLKLAEERASHDPQILDAILEKLEECHMEKNRDVALLNRLAGPFLKNFNVDDLKQRPRAQLLRIIIGLQNANHNGYPAQAMELVERYHALRDRLIEIDRVFCAEIDMNLAVHHHDLFEFDQALAISRKWIEDPLFAALPLSVRGKFHSSRGQSHAFLGDTAAADADFKQALSLFNVEPELLKGEIDHTRVYEAINLLGLDASQVPEKISAILEQPFEDAAYAPKSLTRAPFHEHLYLRMLWNRRDQFPELVRAYLEERRDWTKLKDFHPYELIQYHRIRLLAATDPSLAPPAVQDLVALFDRMGDNGVLGLIRSYMRVELKRLDLGVATDEQFFAKLDALDRQMPAAAVRIDLLRRAWADSSVDITKTLPFNYL